MNANDAYAQRRLRQRHAPAKPVPPMFEYEEPAGGSDPQPVAKVPRFSPLETKVLTLFAMCALTVALNVLNALTSGALSVPPRDDWIVAAAAIPATLLVHQLIELISVETGSA